MLFLFLNEMLLLLCSNTVENELIYQVIQGVFPSKTISKSMTSAHQPEQLAQRNCVIR